MTAEQKIWNFLISKNLTEAAVAGIMGNLQAESNFKSNNLEDSRQGALGSDEYYTQAVDNGSYSRSSFINDKAGYGIAQWTTPASRKAGLYDLCKANNKSISDLDCQLVHLYNELQSYGLITKINNANQTIKDISNIILFDFENPLNKSENVQNYRASLGEAIYSRLHGTKNDDTTDTDIVTPEVVTILRYGSKGQLVVNLQNNLIKLGYSVGPYGADGDFGSATRNAVINFQTDHNLQIDGEVGQETQRMIKKLLNTPQTYKIRRDWNNVESQKGVFKDLEQAKKICDMLGKAYKVFDNFGNKIYPDKTLEDEFPNTLSNAPNYTGVKIGSSSKDERGQYRGGQAGDQTGKEVYINDWYSYNWTNVLRPTNAAVAERIASACEKGCNNNNIGYDQLTRNTLLTEAKKVNMDLSKITTPCNCDCSSFVSVCCVCAGLPESIFFAGGNGRVTSNMVEACMATREFQNLTGNQYVNSKDYLQRGDILLNANAHVVIVLSNGQYVARNTIQQSFNVKVTANTLNIRSGPSAQNEVVAQIKQDEICTIIEVEGGFGKLKSGIGWIDLNYVEKV